MDEHNKKRPDENEDEVQIDSEETGGDNEVVLDEEDGDQTELIKKLREKLKKSTEEKQQYLDGWQRTRADFVNFKKNQETEKKELVRFANEALLLDMISVLDNFDMAFANKEAWEKVGKEWRMGIEYIYSQYLKTLERYQLVQFDPIREQFDPVKHEPTELVPTDKEEEDNKVIAVLQKGYMLFGKIIRPAKVKLGEYKK